jgi:hypothetical protein
MLKLLAPAQRDLSVRVGLHTGEVEQCGDDISGIAGRLLEAFGPPACYLDFEAMMPPIPLYEGTRPYQTIPFQWSLHTQAPPAGIAHASGAVAVDAVAHELDIGVILIGRPVALEVVEEARPVGQATFAWVR